MTDEDAHLLRWRLERATEQAIRTGQPDRAADYAVAIIRLDAMLNVGEKYANRSGGYALLIRHRKAYSPQKASEIIALLEQTLAESDDPPFIAAWIQATSEAKAGWREKVKTALAKPWEHQSDTQSLLIAEINERRKPVEAINRLLQADLAIRAFAKDRGRFPKTLNELTPDYLAYVPLDPYSNRPLAYENRANSWKTAPPQMLDDFVLYSVGPNGEDDTESMFDGIFLWSH